MAPLARRTVGSRRPLSTVIVAGVLVVVASSVASWPASAATPALTTQASASGFPVGIAIFDVATLSLGANPTGTITFRLFGPDNATCSGTAIFTNTKPVSGNGNYTSDSFTTTQAGTYQFLADYSGDANNTAASTACNDPAEQVSVAKRSPTFSTTASPFTAGQITDTATLGAGAGPAGPTGTITFTLFGPNNLVCTPPPIFTSTKTVTGNGQYTSDPFTPTQAGTYQWIAIYSGDANNIAVGTICTDPAEAVIVPPVLNTPTLTTAASPGVTLGGQVTDTATLANGITPTGTIAFTLFGPNDATCAGAAVFTNTKTVTGNGGYPSDPFTPTLAGTYRWRAAYSGDVLNGAVSTACNDPNESVVVSPAPGPVTPTLTTTASAGVAVGGQVTDTATLSGGSSPTGTITFTLFGPNDATCAGTAVFTNTKTVTGNGAYPSDPFTPTLAGTYRWRAAYGGDANNTAVSTACNDANESVVVTAGPGPVTPTLTTTASAGVAVGGQVTDTATLSGGSSPTGTITFTLFGPNDATCAGASAFTNTKTVTGNGGYPSDPFTPTLAGTYRWRAAYGGDANNTAVSTACNDPNESVVVSAAPSPPSITVAKTAAPTSLAEPGGSFTFSIVVTNTGSQAVTVTALTDDVYGNLAGKGTCATGAVLQPQGMYSCQFSGSFMGNAGASQTDVATATAAAANGDTATASDDATVSITDLAPVVSVDKTASPPSRPEPGGSFTFMVVVRNGGGEAITITALTDDKYGNIAQQGTCTSAVGTVLQPQATYTCQFTGTFTGAGGATQTDVVTVTARDDDDTTATATDSATISITAVLPQIAVDKSASPASLPEPGGPFAFTVVVTNTGTKAVTIGALTDDKYGNIAQQGTCTSAVGTVLQPQASYTCQFTGTFTGTAGATQTDVVTARAGDAAGNVATATDTATVAITSPTPAILVDKSVTPATRVEPGGPFTYTVTVTNVSTVALRVTALVDDVYGNLDGRGTCATGATMAAPGGTYSCQFTAPFTGNAGATQTDTATATASTLGGGASASASDTATVTITNATPVVGVVNAVDPASRPEPGGAFTHTVTVTNGSVEPVTIAALVDSVYGDLTTRAGSTCAPAKGTVLQPGAAFSCSFTATFTGEGGDTLTDTVVVTVVDDEGTTATAADAATVALLDVPPKVKIDLTVSPQSRPAPGGSFTYTVDVTNVSNPEAVVITQLRSDVHGDLNGLGTCRTNVALAAPPAAGTTYSCSFTATFTGNPGDRQVTRITVTVVDNEGTAASATTLDSQGTIVLTEALPAVSGGQSPVPVVAQQGVARTGADVAGPARLAAFLVVVGAGLVAATWSRRRRATLGA